MKVVFRISLQLIAFVLFVSAIEAQQLELPQKSPKASTSYMIGLTSVSIDYSSPAVDERKIWGAVVPFNEVWSPGANAATTIEFTTDANVEGTVLPAGKYSFFLIPREGKETAWTAIFNKVSDQWGTYRYNASEDALRVDIKPQYKTVEQDRLVYSIHDQGVDKGYIKMAWEDVRVYIRFKVEVLETAYENIDRALERAPADEKWIIYAKGASFLLDNEWDTRQAMEWADKSTTLKDHSWNWYIKARAQAASGDFSGALASAEKSKQIGTSTPDDKFYVNSKAEIMANVAKWK